MAYLIALCVIIFISCATSILTHHKFEAMLPFSFFIIVFTLYICGLYGVLLTGIYILVLLAILCLGYSCFYFIKDKNILTSQIITPGFTVFLVFALLIFVNSTGRFMVTWDEFTHWGLVVKNMYIFDALGNYKEATTVFKGYPPATALLEYFFVRLKTPFSEEYLFRAMDLFLVSIVLPIFEMINWKQLKQCQRLFQSLPIIFIILLLPMIFYPNIYNNLYVDGFLGLLFAHLLFSYFHSDKQDYFTYLNLGGTAFILVLIKASGVGLVIIAFLIILFDIFVFQRDEIHTFMTTHNKTNKKNINWKNVIWLLFPIFITIIGKYSWSIYLKITNTGPAWNTASITLGGIFELFTRHIPEYRIKTIKNFFSSLVTMFYKDGSFKMSYLLWILFIALSILTIYKLIDDNKREKKRIIVAGIGIIIGFIIYSTTLLILYLFTYAILEATSLASFSRYMNTYLLGALAFVIFCLIAYSFSSNKKISSVIPAIILCILIPFIPINDVALQYLSSEYKTSFSYVQRSKYHKIETLPSKLNIKSDKIYFISQNSTGIDYWITRYSVTPMKISPTFTWNLIIPSKATAEMTLQISANDWAEELKKEYTYVYLFSVDETFKKDYSPLFNKIGDIQNDTLYYVDKSGTSILLRIVGKDGK